jgi:hypothetical protein
MTFRPLDGCDPGFPTRGGHGLPHQSDVQIAKRDLGKALDTRNREQAKAA